MASLLNKFSDKLLYEPLDKIVQKLLQQMIFIIDPNMFIGLSTENLKKIACNKQVIHLSKKNKCLIKVMRNNIGYIMKFLYTHPLVIKKAKVNTALICKKSRL